MHSDLPQQHRLSFTFAFRSACRREAMMVLLRQHKGNADHMASDDHQLKPKMTAGPQNLFHKGSGLLKVCPRLAWWHEYSNQDKWLKALLHSCSVSAITTNSAVLVLQNWDGRCQS